MNTQDFTRALEDLDPADTRFNREWFWVIAAIIWAWATFWYVADIHAESSYAHAIAWASIGLAFWFASNF